MTAIARAFCLILLLLAACSRGGNGPALPTPPPNTGNVAIDMDSWWAIFEIERIDANGQPLPGPDSLATPFLSIQQGQVISIEQGRAYDLATSAPLYETWSPGVPNNHYLNIADGRFWLFSFLFDHQFVVNGIPDCSMYVSIRAAFGTVDDHTLEGIVEVAYASTCPAPAVLRPDPNGRFRVRMGKVAPSRLVPDAGR
ncbi:MAG: hypothetical protein U1E73_11010 [Planctomycetota bacterium]